ncbi:MAG: DUF4255 domain-containing protein [Candidatus Bathyarchaeia archaeon]|jgi:hypothetical protein
MSQKAFISDIDMALANLIWNGIENESSVKNIISSREQISFSSPKATGTQGTRKLSIFLYNLTEETARNMPSTVDYSTKKTTQTTFALHYLVTPFTGNDKDDHSLLDKIIHTLLATPSIASSDEKNNIRLTVKIDSLSLDELSKLWIALGAPLKLSVSLNVSSAEPRYDSQAEVTSGTLAPQTPALDTHVTQLYQAVLKTFTEQSNGWKSRNMVVKQWVLQEFKKTTDMTVEEMLTTLNNLGDKLEQHGSTAQFIKPLNLLAGYYKHQLDQLKGMQKVSHNQSENLETINTWIKEVETLVEVLGR